MREEACGDMNHADAGLNTRWRVGKLGQELSDVLLASRRAGTQTGLTCMG